MPARPPSPDRERLRRAVSALPLVEREILMLSARERLTNEEIAVRLGLGREAVEQHLAGALCEIDRALQRPARRWWRFW